MRFRPGVHPISWFQKEYRESSLTLRPPYQRKPVWALRQKCYLIESILLEYPVPEIFIHETTKPTGETLHAVVDGQQRIRAVLQFVGLASLEEDEAEFTGFSLDKLDTKGDRPPSPFLGKRFTDLTEPEKVKLFEYPFHVRFLHDADNVQLREMFARLNRYLTPLNAQELRHATYVGPFAVLVEALAENEYWLRSGLMTRALIRRLGDLDFVGQLLIGVIHGPAGGSPAVVDEYYRTFEDYDLEEGIPDQRRTRRLFESTLAVLQRFLPDLPTDEIRWGNKADFYSLFVAMAEVLRGHDAPKGKQLQELRTALQRFSRQVDQRLGNEEARVSAEVVEYVRAVEKGVNEKGRRADRHRVLVGIIERTLGLEPAADDGSTPMAARVAKKK